MKIFCNLLVAILLPVFVYGQNLQTPLEKNQYQALSSYNDIGLFLQQAAGMNAQIVLSSIGKSVAGRDIRLVKVSNSQASDKAKLNILIFAQQHGNEPSGKEGLLLLIKQLAEGKGSDWLNEVNLYLIPQLNPDGGEMNNRRNQNNADLNRDHLLLSQPETQALHAFVHENPMDVTLDMHEYFPHGDTSATFRYTRNTDVQFGTLTNINIHPDVLGMCQEKLLPQVIAQVREKGFSSREYLIGSVVFDKRIRRSTVDINDGRQSFGIQNTLSFISEGLNGKTPTDRIEHRANSQCATAEALILASMAHAESIRLIRERGVKSLEQGTAPDSVAVQMEHYKGNASFWMPLLSLATGKDTLVEIKEYHTLIKPRLNVRKPIGYLVPASDSLLCAISARHGVKSEKLPKGKWNFVQYEFTGMLKDSIEDWPFDLAQVSPIKMGKFKDLDKYLFVPVNQKKGLMLVLLLEPQSMFGIVNEKKYAELLTQNKKWPVLRVEKK